MTSESNFIYAITKQVFLNIFLNLFNGEVYGVENFPMQKSVIIAPSHASHLDPPFVAAYCYRHDTFNFARKTLFKPGIVAWLYSQLNMVPLDRDKGSDLKAIKKVILLLKEGNGLVMFPEGTRSKDGNLQSGKKGIGFIAAKAQVPILPVRLFGTFEALNRYTKNPNFDVPVDVVLGEPLAPKDYDPGPKSEDRYQEIANRVIDALSSIQLPT